MTLEPGIVCVLLTAVIALQGWQLREMINMKIRIATMQARLKAQREKKQSDGGDTEFFY